MKHTLAFLLFFLVAVTMFLPTSVQAASLVPCGRTQDDTTTSDVNEAKPCTICHVVVGGQKLIQWSMNIMTVIGITVIFAMGVLYVISAGDEGMIKTAKTGMKAALIGFAVMLSAWLIVNIVLTVLVDSAKQPFAGLIKTNAFSFSCDVSSNVKGQ